MKDVAPHAKGIVTFTIAAKDTPARRQLENIATVTVEETSVDTNKVLLIIPENTSFGFVPEQESGTGENVQKTKETAQEIEQTAPESQPIQSADHNGGIQTGDESDLLKNIAILLGAIALSCGAAVVLLSGRKMK